LAVQGPDLASEDWEAFTEQEKENLESVTDSDSQDSENMVENQIRSSCKKKRSEGLTTSEKPVLANLKSPRNDIVRVQSLKRAESQNQRSTPLKNTNSFPRIENEKDIGLADGYRYELSGSFKPHTEIVRCIKFLNRSKRFFSSGSNDGTVAVYDLELQKVILCFRAHKAGLTDVSWSSNNKFLLTSSLIERSIKIWNYETKKKASSVTFGSGVTAACYNPVRSNHFACGDLEGHLYWYNSQTLERKEIYRDYSIFENNSDFIAPVSALAYGVKSITKQQRKMCWLFAGNASGRLEAFKYLQKKEQYKHLKHVSQKHSITHIVFSERHQAVIINSSGDNLKMYSVPQLELVRVFFHPQRTIPIRCCIDPDSKIVITGSEDGQFRIFDIDGGVLLNSIQAASNSGSAICGVDFSPEGVIVSASSDGEVRVWVTHSDT